MQSQGPSSTSLTPRRQGWSSLRLLSILPRWHFLWYRDTGEMALYDILVDPRSERNLAAENRQLVARFRQRIEEWAAAMGVEPGLRVHE